MMTGKTRSTGINATSSSATGAIATTLRNGNDVSLLSSAVAPLQRVLAAAREPEMTVVHTREGHRPDISDCPPAKFARGESIGDDGPKGRILVRGECGHDIIDAFAPRPARSCSTSPAKARSTPPTWS